MSDSNYYLAKNYLRRYYKIFQDNFKFDKFKGI